MPRLTDILIFGQGGLLTGLAALGILLRNPLPRLLPRVVAICAVLPLLAQILLSTWYLFSPTYIDHIEASVASTTHYFLRGIPVYPRLDAYTFHGLLYGPLLPALNSLGYLVSDDVLASKLVGWAAAWLAVLVMAITTPRAERNRAWAISLAAAAGVLASFGSILTADRADSLLLLFAASALWGVVRLSPFASVVLAGLLAGLAADLKLHGPAYIAPALGLWAARYFGALPQRTRVTVILAASAVMAAGVIFPFLPGNVSAAEYFGYLRLAGKHGLIPILFVANCIFLLCFWVPALFVLREMRTEDSHAPPRDLILFAALLFVAEIAVNVVASKPGAGTHHLLPFVAFHVFFLQQLLSKGSERVRAAAVTGIAVVLVGTALCTALALRSILKFDLQWSAQQAQLEELRRDVHDYPHGMLGIAGRQSYALTLLRPWLTRQGTLQTDYGAWMDWNLSGVSDAPLAEALGRCRIPYLFVPTGGEPFSMDNTYGTGPAFSEAVRAGFAQSYTLVQPGQYYDVYGCKLAMTVPTPSPSTVSCRVRRAKNIATASCTEK